MRVKKEDTKIRDADSVKFWNYLTAETGTSISVAYAELKGEHPASISEKTDRCYMFISADAVMTVGEEIYKIYNGDVVYVEKGKRHSLRGIAKYFVVNNPPYRK